jgi:hypothetical protein
MTRLRGEATLGGSYNLVKLCPEPAVDAKRLTPRIACSIMMLHITTNMMLHITVATNMNAYDSMITTMIMMKNAFATGNIKLKEH